MRILAALALILAAAPALAQSLPQPATSTTASVPTGYQVPGPTYFRMVDGKVQTFSVDPARATPEQIVRAMVTPSDPRTARGPSN